MKCPQCANALEGSRTVCDGCGGMFVTEHELDEMLAAVDTTRYPRDRRTLDDWQSSGTSERVCPMCAQAMVRVNMERVPVERCVGHGVWFDAGELQRTLSPDDGVPQVVREVWHSMRIHRKPDA